MRERFERASIDAPRLTAELLLEHATGLSRVQQYMDLARPLDAPERERLRELVRRRLTGIPTQYLVGATWFLGRRFAVDERVLIPRPETELLVATVLDSLPKERACSVLDLGTGSGCIAVSVAAERPMASVVATDISPGALALARENAAAHGVAERIEFREGSLFAALQPSERFDAIITNPPYIPSGELSKLAAEVQKEPALALDGGPNGFSLLKAIIAAAPTWLVPGGHLAFEMAETHEALAREACASISGARCRIMLDLASHPRFGFVSL